MRRLQAQLGRVLDGDHPLVGRDEPRESAQEGGLARSGASRYHKRAARLHRRAKELRHPVGQHTHAHEILHAQHARRERAHVERRPVRRDRRHHVGGARPASRQHRAAHGVRVVASLARLFGDLVDDATHVLRIVELHIGTVLDAPGTLHVHDGGAKRQRRIVQIDAAAVDHDLGDGFVLQQSLERPVAEKIVDHRTRKPLELVRG